MNVQKQISCRLFITWFVSYISLKCVSNGRRMFYLTSLIWHMLTIFVIKDMSQSASNNLQDFFILENIT